MEKIRMPSETVAIPTERLHKEVKASMAKEKSTEAVSITDRIKALASSVIGRIKKDDDDKKDN